jgi:hypothetical protein
MKAIPQQAIVMLLDVEIQCSVMICIPCEGPGLESLLSVTTPGDLTTASFDETLSTSGSVLKSVTIIRDIAEEEVYRPIPPRSFAFD